MDSNRSLRTIFFEFQTEKPKGKQVENSSNCMEEDSEREQEKGRAMGADMEISHMVDRLSCAGRKLQRKNKFAQDVGGKVQCSGNNAQKTEWKKEKKFYLSK